MDHDFEWRTQAEKADVVRYWWRTQRGLCHLCREKMEPYSLAAISPWAATIEHVKPKRENGPNTVGNVRLAHRWCNNVLGSLWEKNRQRALRGQEPISVHWAMTNEMGKLKISVRATQEDASPSPRPLRVGPEPRAYKAQRGTLAALLATSPPLPRGATLPPVHKAAPAFVHSRNQPARRMTALETARWLRESAEKRRQPWPLA